MLEVNDTRRWLEEVRLTTETKISWSKLFGTFRMCMVRRFSPFVILMCCKLSHLWLLSAKKCA